MKDGSMNRLTAAHAAPAVDRELARYVEQILKNPPPKFGKGKKHQAYCISFRGCDYVLKVCRPLPWKKLLYELWLEVRQHVRFRRHGYRWGGRALRWATWRHEAQVDALLRRLGLPALQEVPIGLPGKRVTRLERLCNLKAFLQREATPQNGGLCAAGLPRHPAMQAKLDVLARVIHALSRQHRTLHAAGCKSGYQLDCLPGNILVGAERVLFFDAEYIPDVRLTHRELKAESLQHFLLSLFNQLFPLHALDDVLGMLLEHYHDRSVLHEIVRRITTRRFRFLGNLYPIQRLEQALYPDTLAARLRRILIK